MQKMSEKEAIEELKCYTACSGTQLPTEIEAAIKALEELSLYKQGGLVLLPADVYQRQCDELDAYKAIGTVDQCREALERMKPKKPVEYEDKYYGCPKCGNALMHKWEKYPTILNPKSKGLPCCWNCLQVIDWSE